MIPILIDSSAVKAIAKNDRHSHRTKHIEQCWLIHHKHCQADLINVLHVCGDDFDLADLEPKQLQSTRLARFPS